MSSRKEVRYVVSRLDDPDDLDGSRAPIGWHPYLDLAKKHADRVGVGTCVDAEGGAYHLDGPYRRRGKWQVEWTNRNLYQGGKKGRGLAPEERADHPGPDTATEPQSEVR